MTEPVGSMSEEATRLFAAAESWWRDAHQEPSTGASAEPAGAAALECRFCPLCQALSLVRTTRPEVFEHLSSAAMSLLHAARAAVETHSHTGRGRPGPAVERIDIR
ncbi:MAG TPA: DUF5304 family protein [Mycobacteriales bacterium]|nr:DUF5304 family protein [Mycobacteriales bacterium]